MRLTVVFFLKSNISCKVNIYQGKHSFEEVNAQLSVHGSHFTFRSFYQQLQWRERWLLTSHVVIASWDTIWRKPLAPSSLGKWISFWLIKVNVTAWLERTATNCVFCAYHLLGVLLCKIKGELVFGSLFKSLKYEIRHQRDSQWQFLFTESLGI